jgi:hypothetical protein
MAVGNTQSVASSPTIAEDQNRHLTRRRLWALVWMIVLVVVADRGMMSLLRRAPISSPLARAMKDRQYLVDHPEARQLLIVGDSRVKWSLDPRILAPGLGLPEGSGLNIGLPASGYGDDAAVAHWLMDSGLVRDVKVVFWGLAFDRFKAPLCCDFNTYMVYQPGRRGGVGGLADQVMTRCLPSVYAGAAVNNSVSAAQARHSTWAQWTGRKADENYAQYGVTTNTKPANPDYQPRADARRHRVGPDDARVIVEAARQLHDRGVRVVFVDLPVTPALLAWQQESPEHWNSYRHLIATLREAGAQVHEGENLHYPPDCFTDTAHLTAAAAVQYNYDLVRDLGKGPTTAPTATAR